MIETIALVGLLLCSLLTLLQLVKKDHWIIRFSDFPHVQTTTLTILFLIVALSTGGEGSSWLAVAIKVLGFMIIVYQASIILPYTKLYQKQAMNHTEDASCNGLSILESNVLMKNNNYDALIDAVKTYNPDILITLESDLKWQEKLSALESDYSYSVKCPFDNTYGMHLYSKLALSDSKVEFLVEENVPSIHTKVQLSNKEIVYLYVVHPKPPAPTENSYSTERDAELVLIAKKCRDLNVPVIVAGDLNDVAWSHTTRLFQRISNLLDPRIGRGFFNTFHTKYPMLRWPLDHIFHSKHFLIKKIKRLDSIGSDHFPMLIELCLAPNEGKAKNGRPQEMEAGDLIEANEKISSAMQ